MLCKSLNAYKEVNNGLPTRLKRSGDRLKRFDHSLTLGSGEGWHAQHDRLSPIEQLNTGIFQLGQCFSLLIRKLDLLKLRLDSDGAERITGISAAALQLDLGSSGEIKTWSQRKTDLRISPAAHDPDQAQDQTDSGHDPDLASTTGQGKAQRSLIGCW